MSAQNVDLVRHSLEAFARGDFDTAFANCSSNVEWVPAADEPDVRTYRGVAGLRDFAASAADPWSNRFDDVVEFRDFIDCGSWIVVPWTAQLRGRGSGILMDVAETYAVWVQDLTIMRVEEYRTTDQALAAVRARTETV
jgi:ketosteroid isomerase-like protein